MLCMSLHASGDGIMRRPVPYLPGAASGMENGDPHHQSSCGHQGTLRIGQEGAYLLFMSPRDQ